MQRMLGIVIVVAAALAPISLLSADEPGSSSLREKNTLPPEVRKVLDTADRFILFSLDPHPVSEEKLDKASNELFHQYRVRRKIDIRTPKERAELLGALYKGISDSDGMVAMCFNPRHGIRATVGGETVDLVICFECLSIEIHARTNTSVLTTHSPAFTFNRALLRASSPPGKPSR
jgi:hypothetical protein